MDQEWNYARNQNVSGNKWKWTQNKPKIWHSAKAVLRGKFIAIQAYLKKIKTFQTNNLILCLQELEEQQQRQPRASRKKEITKIRAELNDTETKSTILRINKYRSWLFEKIKKIDKPVSRLIKKKGEKMWINTIRNERGEITTDTTEIQLSLIHISEPTRRG